MILTGKEDLRVIKTITGIKQAFNALICEKDYEKITVKDICEYAQINKKTFYHYYETLDDLLSEVQTEITAGFLANINRYRLPDDLDEVDRTFFLYSESLGPAYEKITVCSSYRNIRDKMITDVNTVGWAKSPKYQRLSEYQQKLVMNFINTTILNSYALWVESGKALPLEEVVELTNDLVLGGVGRFFD